ncbi:MAG TPA: tRNA 2-thiouridine(34) synthase MnmA [Buchnera sp. (in: enterobacteria)]|nr:tRNA 2-thiouridine(34) synthase MnmA [Buchnera sp. (in: enterobacteria)]
MCNNNKKVIVAMSGGVDSSVAAWLLLKKKYQVEGLFMKNWDEDDHSGHCSFKKDLLDAQKVCDQLGIVLHKMNFSGEYWEYVFQNFLSEYKKGRTPNPDILCNKEIKFKVFLEFALEELQGDYIATGHYVRKKEKHGKWMLLRGIDEKKDQSYFLYIITVEQIKKILFPIGVLKKHQVRHIAKKMNMVNAEKKDSTGICFISPKNIKNFLNRYFIKKKGDILTTSGQKIGHHDGIIHYTLGQRKGLGIGGIKGFKNQPWYVVHKNMLTNAIIVAQGNNNPHLMSIGLIAIKLHWINDVLFNQSISCTVKTRYQQLDILCSISDINKYSVKVIFNKPIAAVTPGQSVVFYLLDVCLGGGIIDKRLPLIK